MELTNEELSLCAWGLECLYAKLSDEKNKFPADTERLLKIRELTDKLYIAERKKRNA